MTQAEKAKQALDAANAAKAAANAAAAKAQTAEQIAEAKKIEDEKAADAAKAAKGEKPAESKTEIKEGVYLNPFGDGVTYEDFLKCIPKKSTVEKFCKDKMSKSELSWLLSELKHYEENKK